jgi:uncharacterized protein YcaQ
MSDVVLMPKDRAFGLGRRIGTLERLARELRDQLEAERHLLDLALRELAEARGEKDLVHFGRRWLRDHRREPTLGIPFTNGRGEA